MEEIWKPFTDFEGRYEVSNYGNGYSLKKQKTMSIHKGNDGYLRFCPYKDKKRYYIMVQRAVAMAFIPIPKRLSDIPVEELEVHHIDFNPLNNCVDNLEWLSKEEHRMKHNKHLPLEQLTLDGKLLNTWNSAREAEKELKKQGIKIHNEHIIDCCKGRRNKAGGFKWRYKD